MRTYDQPFLKIVIPAAAGIAGARILDPPALIAVIGFAAVFVSTLIFRKHKVVHIYLWFTILLFFFAAGSLSRHQSVIPQGVRVEITAQVAENPYRQGRWLRTTANAGYYRIEGDTSKAWTRVNEQIQLYADTCYAIAAGQQLAFRGWLNAVDTTGSSYGNLMRLRGQHGRLYLTPGNLIRIAPHTSRTPVYYASRLQNAAVERLSRLRIGDESLGVVTAMTAGDRRGIGRDLQADYSATGAVHLLSVSGFHVAVVFLLVNILLYLLPALPRGHLYKNAAAIAAIWLYAAMSGLSPPVVRSALMFSFAQAALASGSARNALNIMLGSAVVMLAVNPNYWGDPSFMLSYVAVLSITAFFGPLFRLSRSRYKVVNALLSIVIVGFVASLGTAPLVAYWFGRFPVAGMVINPAVVLTANAIVMLGVLWIVIPFGFLNAMFSWALGLAADVQNAIVEWSASLGWASIPLRLPLWGVILIYIGYIAIAAWANRPRVKKLDFSGKLHTFDP